MKTAPMNMTTNSRCIALIAPTIQSESRMTTLIVAAFMASKKCSICQGASESENQL
jgi:hypothetical protein